MCIAQVCRMTSEALDGQLQSCYTARARPKCLTEKKCFRLHLNRARELQHKVSGKQWKQFSRLTCLG